MIKELLHTRLFEFAGLDHAVRAVGRRPGAPESAGDTVHGGVDD
jgi:hypothetical protein